MSEGGRQLGTTDEGRELILAPGRHDIELTNAHFNFHAIARIEIASSRVTSYTVSMPEAALVLDSPPGVEVWIEGVRIGVTPLADIRAAIGTREVLLRHPERGDIRKVVEVVSGRTTAVTASFEPAAPLPDAR